MGHTDPATTRRYTHATDKAKRIAVEATRVLRFPVCHNSATTQERLPQATAVKCSIVVVGTARFELATSRTPSVRATRLRHVPSNYFQYRRKICFVKRKWR